MHETAGAMRAAQRFEQARDSVQAEFRGLNLVTERVEKPD
jgi:hypothetical protein